MNDLEQMYQQVILDHAKHPQGKGLEPPLAGHVGRSHQVNPTCGDEVTLQVELSEDLLHPVITRITWDGQGCSISQASISVLTELVEGASVSAAQHQGQLFRELMGTQGVGLDDAAEESLGDAVAFTGVSKYPARIKCALLGWAALRDALLRSGVPIVTEEKS